VARRYGKRMQSEGALVIEPGAQVIELTCPDCGEVFQRVTAYVYRDGDAHAVYNATCHHHDGDEARIDATFSPTWGYEGDEDVTFGCRVGRSAGQDRPVRSLVTGEGAFDDAPTFGRKLTRDEALMHPLIEDFWALVDHILVNDPVVRDHVYGPESVPSR
jgi:hypothetical protein